MNKSSVTNLKNLLIVILFVMAILIYYLALNKTSEPIAANTPQIAIDAPELAKPEDITINSQQNSSTEAVSVNNESSPEVMNDNLQVDKSKIDLPVLEKQVIIHNVPFTSQAPLANWEDQRQQDGCEEASVLMAISWALNEKLSPKAALSEILAASDYTQSMYGEYRDTGLEDVLNWLIKDHFNYSKAEIKTNVTIDSLISALENDQIIIMPANGQSLKNPNFKAPGPLNHMLLIRGYDPNKKVFITNDPGTRNGNLYEYPEDVLYSALRTYPTGYKEENLNSQKDVIIFQR